MKKNGLYFFILVLSVIFITNCDKISNNNEKAVLSTKEANMAAAPYLNFDGNEYFLSLSRDEALKLGIKSGDYDKMLIDIELTNDKINEFKNEGVSVVLTDPQKVEIAHMCDLTRAGGESMFNGGSGNLSDNNMLTFTISVPPGASSVNFAIWSNGIIGVGTVALSQGGTTTGSGYAVTVPFYSGSASIKVVGGNTYTVSIRVTSSGGGTYSYKYY